MVRYSKRLAVYLFLCLAISFQWTEVSSFAFPASTQDHEGSGAPRIVKQEQGNMHEVHCSRERSRAAWKIIEEYLMPFVEKERYQFSSRCRLHPQNDMYRDQEQHKSHEDINEWRCGYCKKIFYEEKYLDKHFDNRHYNLLNVSHGKCLADACGALHCDLAMDSAAHKTKCNPAAAARNKHLCESLAESCFPVNEGPSARRLNEEEEYGIHHSFCSDCNVAVTFLPLSLLVPEGDKEGHPRAEAHIKMWTEEEAFIVGALLPAV